MRERVAVTGANGHIGRRLVGALHAAGYEVLALVREEGLVRGWAPANVTGRAWSLDQTTPQDLDGVSAVCHLAAFIPPNLDDPAFARQCVNDNALGTLRVLEAVHAAGIRHVVYASAGQVYGNPDRPASEADPIDLGARAPFYLGSKLLGEIYCRHAAARGMRVVMLRIGSVYGAGMASRATLRRFVDDARAGRAIRLSNGGRYGADFVFVDDVVAAVLASLKRPVSGIYNIGSGARTTVGEIATRITERLGGTLELERASAETPGATGFAALDIRKAQRELGYVPTPITDGLARMMES